MRISIQEDTKEYILVIKMKSNSYKQLPKYKVNQNKFGNNCNVKIIKSN